MAAKLGRLIYRMLRYGMEFVDQNGVFGMEIGTQSKYGFNILLDFKPEATPMRPGGAEILCRRGPGGSL